MILLQHRNMCNLVNSSSEMLFVFMYVYNFEWL